MMFKFIVTRIEDASDLEDDWEKIRSMFGVLNGENEDDEDE